MTRWWCTYCKHGLVTSDQKQVHEECGHITYEVTYKRPEEDSYMGESK